MFLLVKFWASGFWWGTLYICTYVSNNGSYIFAAYRRSSPDRPVHCCTMHSGPCRECVRGRGGGILHSPSPPCLRMSHTKVRCVCVCVCVYAVLGKNCSPVALCQVHLSFQHRLTLIIALLCNTHTYTHTHTLTHTHTHTLTQTHTHTHSHTHTKMQSTYTHKKCLHLIASPGTHWSISIIYYIVHFWYISTQVSIRSM